ncbi:PBECR3 domain-containing polyvalent protein [Aliarcobacter butzleri]|uniref:PBECR3 domain-containing polyvalent protein n=1 Tax=Aliarcobacter butzleri TaxID=28197 RepID=UPI0012FA46B2|nr:hypothetical protein [Aliarcobacter butzleri]
MTFEEFISISLNSNTRDIIYELEMAEDACRAIKKHTNLNICNYKFIIEEEYIRHIRNGHEEDLELLPLIPSILNHFSSVEKSLTRNKQTGQNDVSLVFKKKFDNDVIRMVSLIIMKKKILSLRTFFRQ